MFRKSGLRASARYHQVKSPARRAIRRLGGVRIEPLENRRLLSGVSLAAGVLTVTGTTDNDTAALSTSAGVYHVDLNGTGYDFTDPVTSVNVTMLDGDDGLTIDGSGGNPFPSGGITYDGGTGIQFAEDQLHIIGSAGNDNFSLTNAQVASGAGLIALDGVEVETIDGNGGDDTLTTGVGVFGNVAFDGGTGTDAFTYDASASNDNITLSPGHINAIGFDETYSNLESLTINAGAGEDTIAGGIDGAGSPSTTINGGEGNDAFTITSGLGMVVNGEDGNDTLTLPAGSAADVTFNGGTNPSFIDTMSLYDQNYTFDSDVSAGTARLILEVNSATASVVFNSSQHLESLVLQNGGTATLATNGSRFLSTNQLLIPSGDLDLKDNDLIVRGGTEGSWNGSAYSEILGLVQSGRNQGAWDGNGIRTSSAVNGNKTTLAVASAAELGAGSFDGETLTGSEVLVKYTYGGDANLDGKINIDDYGRIDAHVGQSGSVFGWYNGDFNYDGKINIDDYGIIDSVIGAQGPVL